MTRPIRDLDVPLSTLQVDIWNDLHPVGTPVLAYPETRAQQARRTRTRSKAWEVQRGLPVVHVDGLTGAIHLDAIDPLPDNFPVEA